MTAKEYLSQARRLDQRFCSKLEQMDALERGEPLTNIVDRKAGY